MDTQQKYSFLTYTQTTLPPAQLFVGHHDRTSASIDQLLQSLLCQNNSCNTCSTCMQIREKQHHAIMWLHPEKNYTLEQLEDLFTALTFQLQADEKFFFIIQKADFLTAACANKLLKPMEEPPAGYHFILTAEHQDQLLPTIRSRCIVHLMDKNAISNVSHPLFEIFTRKRVSPYEFGRILDATTINERESIELFDQICAYWLKKYQTSHDHNLIPLIQELQKALLKPPMPGSSTLFWRNVYMSMHIHISLITT